MLNTLFTHIDEINREILLNLDDKSLFNMFKTNKYASNLNHTDYFWIQRIQRLYEYNFTGYNSDFLMYRDIYNILGEYDGDLIKLVSKTRFGMNKHLPILKFIVDYNICVREFTQEVPLLLIYSASLGQQDIFKYLMRDAKLSILYPDKHGHNADHDARDNICLHFTNGIGGYLEILKYMVGEMGARIRFGIREDAEAYGGNQMNIIKYFTAETTRNMSISVSFLIIETINYSRLVTIEYYKD